MIQLIQEPYYAVVAHLIGRVSRSGPIALQRHVQWASRLRRVECAVWPGRSLELVRKPQDSGTAMSLVVTHSYAMRT